MSLMWPGMLWLLLALPLLVGVYMLHLRRRKRTVLKFSSVDFVKAAIGPRQRIRRHLPPALVLLALAVSVFALARPSALIVLPSEQRTIVLAIDVSLSMSASDIEPTRLVAAQTAARRFIREQPSDVLIGIVSFAGTASLVQAPTTDRDHAIAAIDRLLLDRHTAIGSAIIMSLATLFPEQGLDLDLDAMIFGEWQDRSVSSGAPTHEATESAVAPGDYSPGAIILLTDGRNTSGPQPMEAAGVAVERGVKVYTVGFGTHEGATVTTEGWSMYMSFDESTLVDIARRTQGEYFRAGSEDDLHQVYRELNTRFVLERSETELTAVFAAVAALLALLSAVLSLLWVHRSA